MVFIPPSAPHQFPRCSAHFPPLLLISLVGVVLTFSSAPHALHPCTDVGNQRAELQKRKEALAARMAQLDMAVAAEEPALRLGLVHY
eukprot:1152346-Pelagomonas_calceolata.AAC.5